MSFFELKEPPRREDRLKACIADGAALGELACRRMRCCQPDGERTFTQNSICLLLPALGTMNSIPNSVVLMHGGLGCGSSSHGGNAAVRAGNNQRWGVVKDGTWLSTGLTETDVIGGGETKLAAAIIEADRRYKPAVIFVVASCVPGIIGDDVESIAEQVRSEVQAKILPVHCEGFKTKIWATAYDAVYHAIGRTLLPAAAEKNDAEKSVHTVNLMNMSSMGRGDEVELERLLKALKLDVNVFPVFADPENMRRMTQADLSVSTCPTHDDYMLNHLQEKYGIPFIIRHMPIGIENTGKWLRDVAGFFNIGDQAEELIAAEEAELYAALEPLKPMFAGKKAFVSAGEFRALSTAILLAELGFEVAGIRAFHHDEFAVVEYEKLIRLTGKDYPLNIANCQPFEEANLLKRLKPDVFLGHLNGNGTAAKLGITTHVIYNVGLQYVGYRGAYELARRLYRQLSNPRFNRSLSRFTHLPYQESWYKENPFKYIKVAGGETDE
ncbi:MAG TPA: nitrogenase component 1 [Methylomusa anaerophila]|uniref:Nitrogenase molybdenum-iron protein alpha chain n=1 Tax=Methylomusa anaerophila TaxID=1930071 RepID=A0A348AQQ2_9FIRM|nr:nitrogenase component 1 [Methylomusa anaerophila]BBB93400.1 nitrogenase molybdenum-iron protein alpha chain [Methylomusa anaerophila]HML90348.1 nitrogenase component 1 [Methylomusa anaerophila]